MGGSNYWNERAHQHGHTGWGDRVLYAFDQSARLAAIESITKSCVPGSQAVLDFGAGSGDFAAMLSRHFDRVFAFDISDAVIDKARVRHGNDRIEFMHGADIRQMPLAEGSLDLVLSVTVLQHILDEDELISVLAYLRQRLRPDGRLIALEYTPTTPRPLSEYQRFLSVEDWQQVLAKAGFEQHARYGIYHPEEAPCGSFERYLDSLWMRLFRRFDMGAISDRVFKMTAQRITDRSQDYFWPGKPDDCMSIMVYSVA